MSRILFVVDPQVDFASKNGKLYVPGGENAMYNLAEWIYTNGVPTDDELGVDQIIVTLDTHFPTHLTQPGHWIWNNEDEAYKLPHTVTKEELESGKLYSRMFSTEYLLEYLKNVEALGRHLTIWPEHCVKGTEGAAVHPAVARAINWWARKTQTHPIYLEKGDDDPMEMYSLVSTLDSDELNNQTFLEHLSNQCDELYIAGLAEDFCVKFTVEDLIKSGFFEDKLVFLTDCVAAIDPKYDRAIYIDAVNNHGAMEETSLVESWEGYSISNEGGMMEDILANNRTCSNFMKEDIPNELYEKFEDVAKDYDLEHFTICQCDENKFQGFGIVYSGTNGTENSIISTLDKAKEILLKMKDDERVSWANITDMRGDIPDDVYSFAVVYEV